MCQKCSVFITKYTTAKTRQNKDYTHKAYILNYNTQLLSLPIISESKERRLLPIIKLAKE